jgi:hypothetical protein
LGRGKVFTAGDAGFAVKFDNYSRRDFSWVLSCENFRIIERTKKPSPKPKRPHKHGVWLLRYYEDNRGCFRTAEQARRLRQIALWIYNMKDKP